MSQRSRSDRHSSPCVHALGSASSRPTFLYLRDGSRVVIRRDEDSCWLEVVPQATLSTASPSRASRPYLLGTLAFGMTGAAVAGFWGLLAGAAIGLLVAHRATPSGSL